MPVHGLEQGGPAWRRRVEGRRVWAAQRQAAGRGGVRRSIQRRQPVGSVPGTPATGGRAWLLKIEEVGH
jgi:hypothetical protein